MTTIDLIDVFCHQLIIGIDPIDVFLTIGAQLCQLGGGSNTVFTGHIINSMICFSSEARYRSY